jgi:valyl-tRNA synthetase
MEEPLKQLSSAYVASEHESSLYKLWEESGFFNPDKLPGERTESFSMVMPPPKVSPTFPNF